MIRIHTAYKLKHEMTRHLTLFLYIIHHFVVNNLSFLGNSNELFLPTCDNVNTTVMKLLYSTNSKAQYYKANGHRSIDLFMMRDKNKPKQQQSIIHSQGKNQVNTFALV